jgi:hypothetical protein
MRARCRSTTARSTRLSRLELARVVRVGGRLALTTWDPEPASFTHRVDDLDAFWADLVDGAVRASVLIRAQSSTVQGRIRRMYGDAAEWRVGERFELPCAVKLGAATRI